jgi:hypothetical protein
MHHQPFYGQVIDREEQQALAGKILEKYKNTPADEALVQKVWQELSQFKAQGILIMPFKVILRKDPSSTLRPYIEVIFDSKV